MIEIVEIDHGWEAIEEAVNSLAESAIFIGSTNEGAAAEYIDPVDGEGIGLSVAGVLKTHEFGVGVAERSLIREWAIQRKPQISGTIKVVVAGALDGDDDTEGLLDAQGETLKKSIQKFLEAGKVKPDPHEETIENRKVESLVARDMREHSLLDTHQILDSLGYRTEV